PLRYPPHLHSFPTRRSSDLRNEVLFYALLERHLEEMMPIVYTPTVAEAVQRFSRIYRYPRGITVSTENIDRVDEVLDNAAIHDRSEEHTSELQSRENLV